MDHLQTYVLIYAHMSSFSLDLDPMILIYEHGVGILKMCPHTMNEVSESRLSKVGAQTGQTDRQTAMTERITICIRTADL